MENFKHFINNLSCKCCFMDDSSTQDAIDQQKRSQIDVTSISIPRLPSILASQDPTLNLIVVESEKMQVGKVYFIDSAGLKGSDRGLSDGLVYAGSLYYEGEKVINDILLPQSEKGVGKRHFLIQFKKFPAPGYYIKDLGDGMGTFIRLSKPLTLKNNYIISFGDSHMIVFIDCSNSSKLTLKFIDGPKVDEKFKFTPENSPIKIGRMTDCGIKFEDNALSRYHCIITYHESWEIQDGDGRKMSTNGTWLYAEEFFPVYNQMLFKVGETLFRADLKS